MEIHGKHVRRDVFIRIIIMINLLVCCICLKSQNQSKEQIEKQLLNAARVNIEKYRKGNAVVSVTDRKGEKLRNLQVEVNQITQDFLFGNLSE